jgi:hypothetical protein
MKEGVVVVAFQTQSWFSKKEISQDEHSVRKEMGSPIKFLHAFGLSVKGERLRRGKEIKKKTNKTKTHLYSTTLFPKAPAK